MNAFPFYLVYRTTSGRWSALDLLSLEAGEGGEYLALHPAIGGTLRMYPDGVITRRDARSGEYSFGGGLGTIYRGDVA